MGEEGVVGTSGSWEWDYVGRGNNVGRARKQCRDSWCMGEGTM